MVIQDADSDVEVIEDAEDNPRSDYEDPSNDNAAAAEAFEEGALDFEQWADTDEEVDENGNLRNFIDDEAEESDEGGEPAAMEVDEGYTAGAEDVQGSR